jgi:hypothetical protein
VCGFPHGSQYLTACTKYFEVRAPFRACFLADIRPDLPRSKYASGEKIIFLQEKHTVLRKLEKREKEHFHPREEGVGLRAVL